MARKILEDDDSYDTQVMKNDTRSGFLNISSIEAFGGDQHDPGILTKLEDQSYMEADNVLLDRPKQSSASTGSPLNHNEKKVFEESGGTCFEGAQQDMRQ